MWERFVIAVVVCLVLELGSWAAVWAFNLDATGKILLNTMQVSFGSAKIFGVLIMFRLLKQMPLPPKFLNKKYRPFLLALITVWICWVLFNYYQIVTTLRAVQAPRKQQKQ